MAEPRMPRPGEVVYLGKTASVQFAAGLHFRIIRVHDWPTYTGWVWLDGYELNTKGEAIERRSVFVQIAGIKSVGQVARPANPQPRMPRQRTPHTRTHRSSR